MQTRHFGNLSKSAGGAAGAHGCTHVKGAGKASNMSIIPQDRDKDGSKAIRRLGVPYCLCPASSESSCSLRSGGRCVSRSSQNATVAPRCLPASRRQLVHVMSWHSCTVQQMLHCCAAALDAELVQQVSLHPRGREAYTLSDSPSKGFWAFKSSDIGSLIFASLAVLNPVQSSPELRNGSQVPRGEAVTSEPRTPTA